jgi:hypothetical protein
MHRATEVLCILVSGKLLMAYLAETFLKLVSP